ncbi:hypothetical protein U0035_07035 [Niabella yanshanensis]|uniref:Uncharacterized protein n=1 Tax=Niabella yanshanensis TaxID=577386 RepID=A0ABZ0W9E3_9BACT|nr:hypothetical protein [Niabella yanshanensis]WQD39903.1 hypothetical protein U0035_07035 [Niabella yanshanensis]
MREGILSNLKTTSPSKSGWRDCNYSENLFLAVASVFTCNLQCKLHRRLRIVGDNSNHGEKLLLLRCNFIDLQESYIVLNKPKLINSRTVFVSTVIIVPVLSLIVYLSGLQSHRSLYLNSLVSTTILSLTFFIFITTGLYNGWKLKDSYGNFLKKFSRWKKPGSSTLDIPDLDFDSIEPVGCIVSLLIWLILAVFGSIILWTIGAMVWAIILVIAGLLYWIIFRAYRLIFLNSPRCKNNLSKSMRIALTYTILYNCWIYAIIFGAHYLQENFIQHPYM